MFSERSREEVEDDCIYKEKFTNEVCFEVKIELAPSMATSASHYTVQDKIENLNPPTSPTTLVISPTYTLRVEESKVNFTSKYRFLLFVNILNLEKKI